MKVRTEIPDEEVKAFLAENQMDPIKNPYFCAEALAGRYGLPIYEAQRIVRAL